MRRLRASRFTDGAQTLRERLRGDGYLLLRGLIPTLEVERAATALTSVLAKHSWVCDETARLSRRLRRHPPAAEQVDAVYRELQGSEPLHRLVCHPTIHDVIGSLLGPAVVHPQRIIRTTLPVRTGGPPTPAVHRDYPSWRVTDMITVWLPLLPCSPERGGLCVLEYSHTNGLACPTDLLDPQWATTAYHPGDALLLHCYTAHGALPNTTGFLRLSVDSRWQSIAHPVPDWACRPDRGHDWQDYTTAWSSTAWIELPPAATVIDDEHRPWDELTTLPPSPLFTQPDGFR